MAEFPERAMCSKELPVKIRMFKPVTFGGETKEFRRIRIDRRR